MKRALRSNAAMNYVRRAHWLALGLKDEDMDKPKIAIVNSSSNLAICFSHLDDIAKKMTEAIYAAGGIGFEVRTAAPADFITGAGSFGYIQSSRDLIVNDIEIAVEGARLDGMVCLASCDKTLPGQLMAAGRINIPTLVVACGYQPSGQYRGEHLDIEDLFINMGYFATGRISDAEIKEMSENAILGPGVCPGFGTANSMHVACEALGMTLPGTTPVLANSPRMWEAVSQAGERIVQMVWDDIKPRDILTPEAFANAVKVMLCISGSVNTVKHLQAIAREARSGVDVYGLFERHADEIPLLTAVRPNGDHVVEDFEVAGGTKALMKQLERFLSLEVKTVTGRTMGEILRDATVADEEIIRPVERALATRPSINLVRGSLAPDTAIIKLAVEDDRPLQFKGPAVVYDSEDEGIKGLKDGKIKPGQVVVIRGLGLKGGPGFGGASRFIFALDGEGLTGKVAVVTDGHLSGLVNKTLLVCEVCPEAADGGPLALVENEDVISIDVKKKIVDLEVSKEQLAERKARLQALPDKDIPGWLGIYKRVVKPLSDGAVLVD
jgi:dihydroxy-acid dehydratase